MPTVAVFAEILIVGLEAAVWVALMILAIFGKDWVHPAALKGWEALVTVLILASAYVLGVLVDRAANSILDRLQCKAWFTRWFRRRKPNRDWTSTRIAIMAQASGEGLVKFLEYLRSRVRIARGTSLNFVFIALTTLAFGFVRTSASRSTQGVGLLVTGVAMLLGIAFVSFLAWNRLDESYKEELDKARRHLQGHAARSSVEGVGEDGPRG